MRRSFLTRLGTQATCLGIGCAVLACSESSPTETSQEFQTVRFALSQEAAQGFDQALDDVRSRILPALGAVDASQMLTPLLDELTAAIVARDQTALRRVLARTESAIAHLGQGDAAAAAEIGSELDAVRLILDQARPLADGASGISPR